MNILKEINRLIRLTEIYETKKFWQDVYDKDDSHWLDKKPSNLAKKIINKYGLFNRILEIGCGSGVDTFLLASIVKDKIYAIDFIKKVIDVAKSNLQKQTDDIRKKVVFEIEDVENLKYADKFFDFVYSLSVLHSTNLNKSLKEIHRVLTDDGKAIIHILIDGDEGADEDLFIKQCEKYFNIVEKKKVERKDSGEDEHKALIVFLEVK